MELLELLLLEVLAEGRPLAEKAQLGGQLRGDGLERDFRANPTSVAESDGHKWRSNGLRHASHPASEFGRAQSHEFAGAVAGRILDSNQESAFALGLAACVRSR